VARLLERVRIGIVGLGWVGQEVARAALEDPRVRLVGVADSDPTKASRDLGEILGEGRLGIPIDADIDTMLRRARPEVAVLATTSDTSALTPLILDCLAEGAHVVTSCENLASPELLEAHARQTIDEAARKAGVVVLATGINPGFSMDRLPVMLSQATRNIRRVRVQRIVDAASRRAQLQAKAGIGMSAKEFIQAMNEGRVGHQGLGASLRLVAKGLGVSLDRTAETLRPLLAETRSDSSVIGPVEPGGVRGIYQVARGYRAAHELITLELIIALDEPNARDTIDIIGEPPLHFTGELPGDMCTVATVLSAIPLVVTMIPGLRTVLDLPAEQPEEPAPDRGSVPPRAATTELPRPAAAELGVARRAKGKKKTEAAAPSVAPASKKRAAPPEPEVERPTLRPLKNTAPKAKKKANAPAPKAPKAAAQASKAAAPAPKAAKAAPKAKASALKAPPVPAKKKRTGSAKSR